jgi:P-type Ca2+ transporter type 2C
MTELWYAMTPDRVAEELAVDLESGLRAAEACARLEQVGPNELAAAERDPWWRLLIAQFQDFMVLVLLAATAIAYSLGEKADAVTIVAIVAVNALLGFVQEFRAEKSLEALRSMAAPVARVRRDRREEQITAARLVPGDFVFLEAGDRVPADLRLVESHSLEVEEAALTGESLPVWKQAGWLGEGEVPLGDRKNMAFAGTTVTRGRGSGLVVATGMETEMGRIAGMMQEVAEEETPLQRRLDALGKWLVLACLAVCAVVVVTGVLRGEPLPAMFLAGVSLAVAAIPEGLPAIVTVSLALGVQRMIRRNAIVRRLQAVETLGCATVICSDKAGSMHSRKIFGSEEEI